LVRNWKQSLKNIGLVREIEAAQQSAQSTNLLKQQWSKDPDMEGQIAATP
jgi:hypothetical protein